MMLFIQKALGILHMLHSLIMYTRRPKPPCPSLTELRAGDLLDFPLDVPRPGLGQGVLFVLLISSAHDGDQRRSRRLRNGRIQLED